jgi:hypothetical protein
MGSTPPLLLEILETLKKENIYLSREGEEVKTTSGSVFEEKAIRAVNDAINQLNQLAALQSQEAQVGALTEAARLLEKIQVAAAEAERTAYIVHTRRAEKASYIARRIALFGRDLFHEMKSFQKQHAA